jgi:hypothetical protein
MRPVWLHVVPDALSKIDTLRAELGGFFVELDGAAPRYVEPENEYGAYSKQALELMFPADPGGCPLWSGLD